MKQTIFEQRLSRHYDELKWLYMELYRDEAAFDRFVSMLAELDSIRDTIAFPKNNSGRDVMNESPSPLDPAQLEELNLRIDLSDDKK